jgi:hypothetical protein
MPAFMMQFTVDLVGKHQHSVFLRHARQRFQFIRGIRASGRIAGIVQNHDAGPQRIFLANIPEALRTEPPLIVPLGRYKAYVPADNTRLRRIGNPARRGNHQVAVIDQLQDEHQFLWAGADKHVFRGHFNALSAAMVVGHCFAQLQLLARSRHREIQLFQYIYGLCDQHGLALTDQLVRPAVQRRVNATRYRKDLAVLIERYTGSDQRAALFVSFYY